MDIGEILGKIGFDPNTFIVTIINFLIVFFLLKKFLFDKIGKTLDERQDMIQQTFEDSKRVGHELAMAEQKSKELIDEAKQEGNKIIEKSKKSAVETASIEKKKAQEEIDQMKKSADEKIEEDKKQMIDDVKKEAVDLAMMATEKIIEKELDEKEDKNIIQKYLDKLGSKNEKE